MVTPGPRPAGVSTAHITILSVVALNRAAIVEPAAHAQGLGHVHTAVNDQAGATHLHTGVNDTTGFIGARDRVMPAHLCPVAAATRLATDTERGLARFVQSSAT